MALAALLLSSCASLRPVKETVIYDTVRVDNQVVIRDTIIKSVRATVTDTFEVPCPEMNLNISRQSGHAKLRVNITGGQGSAECICDSTEIRAQIRDHYEKIYHARGEKKTRIITKKYVPKWIKFLAWSGAIFYLLLLIIIIWKIKKAIS